MLNYGGPEYVFEMSAVLMSKIYTHSTIHDFPQGHAITMLSNYIMQGFASYSKRCPLHTQIKKS